mmetsp:Transcript_132292/g.313647  ORF Transcript_132292/g.313647 Transcript_132292/m.313647 type:complete len:250 (-) Transcript_132292:1739-2488(-)
MQSHLLTCGQRHRRRPVHKLEVALCAELHQDVLQRLVGAVHHEQLQHQVEGVHLQKGLHVDRVRQASHLLDLGQSLRKERAIRGRLCHGGAPRGVEVLVIVHAACGPSSSLPLPQLAEDDALVRCHALLLHLLLLAQRPLGVLRRQLQDLGQLPSPLGGAPVPLHQLRCGQLRRRQLGVAHHGEGPDALAQPHRAVALLPAANMLLHQLEDVHDDQQHLIAQGHRQVLQLDAELGQGHSNHGREQEIST